MPHISIKAEPLADILGFHVTNSYITSLIVMGIFFILAFFYNSQFKAKNKSTFFYLIQALINGVYNLFRSVLGERTDKFFPLIASFFFFILLQNWFALLPGVGSVLIGVEEEGHQVFAPILRAATADLNTTLALAVLAVVLIQYYGVKYLGAWGYAKKFFNFTSPVNFFIGILEVVGEFSRIISFSFRLFGNVFAGEVLIAIMAFLVPVAVSFPFLMFEIFSGFIQALVFSMLTAVFISMAIESHH